MISALKFVPLPLACIIVALHYQYQIQHAIIALEWQDLLGKVLRFFFVISQDPTLWFGFALPSRRALGEMLSEMLGDSPLKHGFAGGSAQPSPTMSHPWPNNNSREPVNTAVKFTWLVEDQDLITWSYMHAKIIELESLRSFSGCQGSTAYHNILASLTGKEWWIFQISRALTAWTTWNHANDLVKDWTFSCLWCIGLWLASPDWDPLSQRQKKIEVLKSSLYNSEF